MSASTASGVSLVAYGAGEDSLPLYKERMRGLVHDQIHISMTDPSQSAVTPSVVELATKQPKASKYFRWTVDLVWGIWPVLLRTGIPRPAAQGPD